MRGAIWQRAIRDQSIWGHANALQFPGAGRIRSIRIVSGHIRFLYGKTDYINPDCIRSYPYFASLHQVLTDICTIRRALPIQIVRQKLSKVKKKGLKQIKKVKCEDGKHIWWYFAYITKLQ